MDIEFFNENTNSQSEQEEDADEAATVSPKKKVRVMNTGSTPQKNIRKRKSSSSSLTPSRKSPRFARRDISKEHKEEEQSTDTIRPKQSKIQKEEQITDDSSSSEEEENSDNDIEDITPGPGPKKIFDIPMEPKEDMQGNLKLANYWAKAAKCEKLRSKKKEFLEKSDFFMKHYMDLKAKKGITGAATIPEMTSKPNTRSHKRTVESSPAGKLAEEPKKQKLMSTTEAKKVLAAAKKSIGLKRSSRQEQISDEEEENNFIPPSPEPKAKKAKKFLTKDPNCKHDKDLMKAKKYELRSQDKKKKQDGDCSKDMTWEPNTSDETETKLDDVVEVQEQETKSAAKAKPNTKPVKTTNTKKPKKGSGKKRRNNTVTTAQNLSLYVKHVRNNFLTRKYIPNT